MERTGSVERLHVAPESGASMEGREAVDAVAGRGLRGDRYYQNEGLWNLLDDDQDSQGASEVTFIEAEAIEAIERDYDLQLDPGAHRRNITTRGVALNHLVGKQFQVGEAIIEGKELCEPCGYLQAMTAEDDLGQALAHRGGLDAIVVTSGRISTGDTIKW